MGASTGLVSTGPFAAVDATLTVMIFCLLPLEARLSCVSAVCKGWRALRREPELWRAVKLTEQHFSAAGLTAFFLGPRSPLPSPGCVQELALVGNKKFDAKAFKAVLAACTGATRIALEGKKLSKDCVLQLVKRKGAAPLQALRLGRTGSAREVAAAALEVLGASPALTELALDGTLSAEWVEAAASRCAAARAGGTSLLHTLDAGAGDSWQAGLEVDALWRMGRSFPELERLSIASVRNAERHRTGGPAWAPLPRLRELRIKEFGDAFTFQRTAVSGAQVTDFMSHVAAAAPGLQLVHVANSEEYLSGKDRKAGRTDAPVVPIGAALGGLGTLQQLRELFIAKLGVRPADVAGADLPALERLRLQKCGSHAAAAAAALAAAAPLLASLTLEFVQREEGVPGGDTGTCWAGLAALDAPALRELSLNQGFQYTSQKPHDTEEVARETRGLAARRACPALRSLKVLTCTNSRDQATPFFEAEHPWLALTELALTTTPQSLAKSLAALRAPQLTALTVPGIIRGVARNSAPPAPAIVAAYEKLRAHSPKLPPLRYVDAQEAKREPEEEEGDGDGAGPSGAGADD